MREDNNNNNENDATPKQFDHKNSLEICNWLVKHPQILELANKMLAAESTTSLDNVISSATNISSNRYTDPFENKVSNEHLHHLLLFLYSNDFII
jgi:hypothetical protein